MIWWVVVVVVVCGCDDNETKNKDCDPTWHQSSPDPPAKTSQQVPPVFLSSTGNLNVNITTITTRYQALNGPASGAI